MLAVSLIFMLLIAVLCLHLTGATGDNGTKNVGIMVPLKYFSNFWTTLEMPLINCEINLILIWSDRVVFF